jgi:hypothetical protein
MSTISRSALAQIEDALVQYEVEVAGAPLSPSTKETYLLHASNFVRWLKGDFQPGSSKFRCREPGCTRVFRSWLMRERHYVAHHAVD